MAKRCGILGRVTGRCGDSGRGFTVIEVKPGKYRVPAIDNRLRAGYAMSTMVKERFGCPAEGKMVLYGGSIVPVYFGAFGWGFDKITLRY